MIEVDCAQLLADLEKYKKEVQRKLEFVVTQFSYHIAQVAITNTPLGDLETYLHLYQKRQRDTGLEAEVGFARGSWQVSSNGQFSVQELYTVNSGNMALSLVKTNLADYKLGQDVYIGNKGFYIKYLEMGSSKQAPLGIMKPTLETILVSYKTDIKSLYERG